LSALVAHAYLVAITLVTALRSDIDNHRRIAFAASHDGEADIAR